METYEALRPSVVLSETHRPSVGVAGAFGDIVERIAEEGFFQSVELVAIADKDERKRIGEVVHSHNLSLTQWMGNVLFYGKEELSPASIDETIRQRAVRTVKSLLEDAVECGTSYIGINSGSDPGPELRDQATEQVYRSLCEICEAARPLSIQIVLEPFDREAYKKGLIGPAGEASALVARIRETFDNMTLCWDSSHVMLEGEDLVESLGTMSPLVSRLHFANPVLDRTRDDFGDNHIRIGAPGDLSIEMMADVLRKAINLRLVGKNGAFVAAEVRTTDNVDPWDTVAHCETVLKEAWELAAKR